MALRIDIKSINCRQPSEDIKVIIENICKECTLEYNINLYAGVYLTKNNEIRTLNREYRNIDKPTDVLSFPLLTACNGDIEFTDLDKDTKTGEVMIGDITISKEMAKEQADDYGHSYNREIAFLVCHGMLHLLGFDHETEDDKNVMFNKQKEILTKFGYTR